MSSRRGFTMVELLIGVVVTGILGVALVRMVMFDARLSEDREAWRTARQATRSALAVLTSDLRMVEPGGGVVAASTDGRDLTIRVPYAFGVMCLTSGNVTTLALLPVDSVMFAQPGFAGFAWRDRLAGTYTYVPGGTLTLGASSAPCTAAPAITPVAGGQMVSVTGTVPLTVEKGAIFLLYRRVRYEIKASVLMPGETALWRTVENTSVTEELAVPFGATTRFRYHVAASPAAQDLPPAPLSNLAGVELALEGRSDRTARTSASRKTVAYQTSIYFRNR